jgi:hypothetical protein
MKGNYSGSAESNFWALQRAVRLIALVPESN